VFANGVAAVTAQQRLIYNALTGSLSYDQDGNGTAPAVQIATFINKPAALAGSDFVLAACG
jgi:Ca2+-binding RTX toxin-like protein